MKRRLVKFDRLRGLLPAALMLTGLSACGDSSEPGSARWTDSAAPPSAPARERWYSDQQVAIGQPLFRVNCARCHRDDASGDPDWRRRDAAGKLKPPPLNGSGHTWHHPLTQLRRVVRDGGAPWQGTMPAFGNQLEPQQIDAILAWAQSHWSDDIYAGWLQRGGLGKQ